MFKIEYLLMAFVASFVTRDYGALVAYLDDSERAAPPPQSCQAAPAPNRDWS
jgi:hypothetical protein